MRSSSQTDWQQTNKSATFKKHYKWFSMVLIKRGKVVLLVRDSSRVRGNRFLSKLNLPSWILSSTQDVRPASGDSSLSFTETKPGLQRSASHCAVWMFVISHETELSQNVTTTDSLALLKHQQELNSWREVQRSVRETLMFPLLQVRVTHYLMTCTREDQSESCLLVLWRFS